MPEKYTMDKTRDTPAAYVVFQGDRHVGGIVEDRDRPGKWNAALSSTDQIHLGFSSASSARRWIERTDRKNRK